jgi:hypothetical protein
MFYVPYYLVGMTSNSDILSSQILDQGTSVYVDIVDYFTAEGIDNYIGLSPIAFEKFAPTSQGIITGVEWSIL